MTDDLRKMAEEALAQYHRSLDEAAKREEERRAVTATGTAPRRVVTVTVGAGGRVADLKFPTNQYKSLPPAELASVILKTIEEAAAKLPADSPGFSVRELAAGSVDVRSLFGGSSLDDLLGGK
ncbi:YbaB/EbfC family nucleoid-associated protein [Amycolatopsis sp. NPDC058986]|uniref:YbaB/EbfC family nucleoid-associated protein n=1 Tax=unclassified Amycolatopsis TaxID=2618356 RepID=UPI00366F1033